MSRTPILDPQAVTVIGTDGHLPAIEPAELTPEALRRRFARPPVWTPEFTGDGSTGVRPDAAAAVLIPLVVRDDGLHVLLTRRTAHLRDHAGQISFPGGRTELEDLNAVATALRETEEEIGLARDNVEVLGSLPAYRTITNFVVTPVVGMVRAGFALKLDAFEVDEVFEVPLAFLMNPAHHQRHRFEHDGESRQFLSMPWREPGADGLVRTCFVWGATAAMLRNLYRMLAA